MYLLNWRNPVVRRAGREASITINTPGIYDGLDLEDMDKHNLQSIITLGTTGLVRIRGSRLKTNGNVCFDNSAAGRQLQVESSLIIGGPPNDTGRYARAFDLYRFALFIVQGCDFVNTGGMKMAAGGLSGSVGTLIVQLNRALNIISARGNGAGGLVVPSASDTNATTAIANNWNQFLQLTGLNLTTSNLVQVFWNEIVNKWKESMPGDSISVIDCAGNATSQIDQDDNLIDGGYAMYQYSLPDANGSFQEFQPSPAGNRLYYPGTGMMIETGSSGSSYVRRRRNVVIACTNGGLSSYGNSTNILADGNRIVCSGLAPDGTQLASAGGPGMYATSAVSGTYSNNDVRHTRAQTNGGTRERADVILAGGSVSQSGTTPGGSTLTTLADEQAARDFWLAKKRAAGVYPGSPWASSPY